MANNAQNPTAGNSLDPNTTKNFTPSEFLPPAQPDSPTTTQIFFEYNRYPQGSGNASNAFNANPIRTPQFVTNSISGNNANYLATSTTTTSSSTSTTTSTTTTSTSTTTSTTTTTTTTKLFVPVTMIDNVSNGVLVFTLNPGNYVEQPGSTGSSITIEARIYTLTLTGIDLSNKVLELSNASNVVVNVISPAPASYQLDTNIIRKISVNNP